jgi:hypothetical protein
MQFAMKYLDMGLSVIPLRPGGKEPLFKWQEYQSRKPTGIEVQKWYSDCPTANLGIVTGSASGIVVVDLDGVEGIESGRLLGLASPVTVLTGNGKQLYYKHPGGTVCNSVKKVAKGVDVRGDGGYVVAPPSLHPNGKKYCWLGSPISSTRLPPLPNMFWQNDENKTLSTTPVSGVRKPEGWIAEALRGMKNGNIDETLFRVCSRLRNDGYSESDALVLLQPHAARAGATAGHLDDKIRNVWARYQPKPRDISGPTVSASIEAFLEDIQQVEWICKPIIAKKSIGFVAGLPETMKTWALVDLAVECARESGAWLGLFPVRKSKVLFIDQERFKGETQRRFRAVIAGKGLKRQDLSSNLFVKCGTTVKLDIEASYQSLRNELLELKPDLVVVDSFATFHNTQDNDRMAIQTVLNRIKSLRDEIGCTFIFINHESKMVFQHVEDGKSPNAFDMLGSVGIVAAAEFCLTVRKIDANTSMMHHTKSSLATASKSFSVSLEDLENGVRVKGTL